MLKNRTRRIIIALMTIFLILGQVIVINKPVSALGKPDITSSVMNPLINETTTTLAPGVQEKHFTFTNSRGDRTEAFSVDVNLNNKNTAIYAGTPNDGKNYAMQPVRDQANAAIQNGKQVVAAVNGDFYNMATGEPLGAEIKDGVEIKGSNTWNFFGIKKDGMPIIGNGALYSQVKGDLQQALGGPQILVKDGKIVDHPDDIYPTQAVGIRADNSVFFITVDGKQSPYSNGITLKDLAQMLIDMGAVQALQLDGGGSATYVSRTPGDDSLSLKNRPSDGTERPVGNSWLIASNMTSDHQFTSANISPYDKTYTPNATILFTAKGVDAAGYSAPLPKSGLSWSISDPSFGTIDAATGEFRSNGKTGEFKTQLSYNGKIVGTTNVEIAIPDDIHFVQPELSLKFNAAQDLGLVARYHGRDVNLHAGDIQWNYDPSLGTMDDQNIFHSSGVTSSGPVTASWKGTSLSSSVNLKVGQLPTILYDFENGLDDWAPSTAGRGEQSSISISKYPDDLTRFGNQSLKVNYDFTNGQKNTTLGVYAGPSASKQIPGMPTAIGMWVYATPEAQGYWLRMYVYDAKGTFKPIDLTSQTEGINWTGWKYVEAAIPSGYQGPFTTFPKQMIRMMSLKSGTQGPMTKGSIYVDNIRAVYGANVDDLKLPIVDSINADGKTYTTSNVGITASIHDDMSDKYATGINWDRLKIVVDGKDYSSDATHFSYDKDGTVSLNGYKWADGMHEVKVDIQDNFGNETVKTGYFTVNTGSGTKVELNSASDRAALGGTFNLNIATNNSADIKGITSQISVDKNYPVTDVQFSQSAAGSTYTYDPEKGMVTLNITNSSTLSSDHLATIHVSVPKSTPQGSVINYRVNSSSIQYVSAKDSNLNPTFSSKPMSVPVVSTYQLYVKSSLVGKDGVVLVTDNSGNPAENVAVNMNVNGNSTALGQTDAKGMITSPAMTDSVKKLTLYAEKDGLYSFSVATQSYSPYKGAVPSNLLAGTTADPKTQKNMTWMSNPLTSGNTPKMQYAVQSDYEANGDAAWNTAQGKYFDQTFSGNQDITTNGVVRLNSAIATSLKPSTTYVFRVGDGSNWSDIRTFTTASDKNSFRFVMFGDTQSPDLAGLSDFNKILDAVQSDPVKPDFKIHVGDFIDDSSKFNQWDNITSVLNNHPALDSIDMVSALGNHEYMGDANADSAKAIFNLPQNGPKENLGAVYSTDYNNMHISVISYTTDADLLQKELDWLRTDVKNSDKPFKVVVTHQPMYNTDPSSGVTIFNTMARPVMDELGIDLVVSGHDHAYARTNPLKNGVESPDGTTYLEIGTTGPKHYSAANDGSFAVMNDGDFAMYLTADVTGGQMSITAKQANGTVIDQFTIAKNTDATLSHIKVNGTAIPGFSSDKTDYTVTLPAGETVPEVSATTTDGRAASVVTQAPALPGTATIAVTAQDGTTVKTYKVNFKVDPLDKVTITSDQTAIDRTKTAKISTAAKLQSGAAADLSKAVIQFTSSNPSIASVDGKGVVTANKVGSADITAAVTLGGKIVQSNSVTITVNELKMDAVQLGVNTDQSLVGAGEELQVKLTAKGAKNLYGLDSTFSYDPSFFQLERVSVDKNFAADSSKAYVDYKDANGKVRIITSLTGAPQGVSRDVNVIDIKLKAKNKEGKTSFVLARGAQASDSHGAIFTTPEDVVSELAVANADVTGGGIAINDLVLVARAFGTSSGNPGYNAALDMNRDGVIDIVDIAYVARKVLGL